MKSIRLFELVPLLALLFLVGCGGGDAEVANRPKTLPAGGTVTRQGQPVEGATVTFIPTSAGVPGQAGAAPSATGITDAEGKFQLTTYEAADGAVPGSYKVTVVKREPLPASAQVDQDDPNYNPNAPPPPPPKHLLPEKYAQQGTTDLTATVAEDGQNQFTLDLAG